MKRERNKSAAWRAFLILSIDSGSLLWKHGQYEKEKPPLEAEVIVFSYFTINRVSLRRLKVSAYPVALLLPF